MLIKSECQALDKTRHKPTWNLFEQHKRCKMARVICRATWPLDAHTHTTLLPSPSTETRRPGRQSTSSAPLSGWHQPSDTAGKQTRVMARPCSPAFTQIAWRRPEVSRTFRGKRQAGGLGSRGPIIMKKKASPSLHFPRTGKTWRIKCRMFGVGTLRTPYNRAGIKKGVFRGVHCW